MKIYIGFSRPTAKFAPFAWAIQAIEKRPYDHAYVRMQEPKNNQWMIFQASKTMVNMFSIPWFLHANIVIKEYEIECSSEHYAKLWKFAMDNLGVPYSTKQIIGIFLRKIFHIKQILPDGTSGEVCSELAARVCKIMDIPITEDLDSITPSDLDELLSSFSIPCVLTPTIGT